MEAKHTKGEWKVIHEINVTSESHRPICACGTTDFREKNSMEINEANAKLIADAGTTTNKCGLYPSELLERYNEAIEALYSCAFRMAQQLSLSQIKVNKTEFERETTIAKEVLNKALKLKS